MYRELMPLLQRVNTHAPRDSFPSAAKLNVKVTTDPSPDVAPINDRQMVILERLKWWAWSDQTGKEGDLLQARERDL
jgi:putative SOS response-associated peptidase YedK